MNLPGPLADALADRERLVRLRAAGAAMIWAWQGRADVQALRERLAAMDAALPADAAAFAAALAPWLEDERWYRDLIGDACGALAGDPLAELPLGMQPGGTMRSLALIEVGGAGATLSHISADGLADAVARGEGGRLLFGSGYSLVCPVAGMIEIEQWRLDRTSGAIARVACRTLAAGSRIACDNRQDQLLIRAAPRDAVVLSLSVTGPEKGEALLEFDAASGRLLRRGTADPAVSRMLLLLAIIPPKVEGRSAVLASLSRDADPLMRWQAMRHWLAGDVPGALPRLRAMARRDGDGAVRSAARATLALLARLAGGEAGGAA